MAAASSGNFQVYNGTAPETVEFSRATASVIISVSTDNTTIAFEGSDEGFTLLTGSYQFTGVSVKEITFGGTGSFSVCGIAP